MTSSAHLEPPVRSPVITMALWLVVGLAVAALNAIAGATGLRGVALGWSVHPGLPMIWLIVIACIAGLRKASLGAMVGASFLLFGSTLMEFLGLPRAATSLFGVSLVLLSEILIVRATESSGIARALWFALGSYIQSVFLYNLLLPGQIMHCFRPGWTL